MPPFPPIQRLCPYLDRLDEVIEGGFCRMCSREVHDLTAMDEKERSGFLAARGGDACVSYTMHVKPALAAALIAASAAVLAAPDAALAAKHQAERIPHSPRRVPHVRVQPIPIVTAGLPALVQLDPPREPSPPPPDQPPPPPEKAD